MTFRSIAARSVTACLLAGAPLTSAAAQEPGAAAVICLAPARAQMATNKHAETVDAVSESFAAYLTGPTLSTAPLTARLAAQAREEARAVGCPFVLFTTLAHIRREGRGVLRRVAGSVVEAGAYEVAGATGSRAALAAAGAAGSALRDLAGTIRVRDELTLEYRLEAVGGATLVERREQRKAKADGEDLLTPLVERAAEGIAAALARPIP